MEFEWNRIGIKCKFTKNKKEVMYQCLPLQVQRKFAKNKKKQLFQNYMCVTLFSFFSALHLLYG